MRIKARDLKTAISISCLGLKMLLKQSLMKLFDSRSRYPTLSIRTLDIRRILTRIGINLFGLRFDLKRRNESLKEFAKRVNASERDPGEKMENKTDTDNWFFGQNSVSAGSLHCDIWTGSAAKLLTRDMVCVHPVGGWWRNRADRDIRSQKTRYAIIVSLKTESTDIDLYTPIKTLIESEISTEISFKRDLEETTE